MADVNNCLGKRKTLCSQIIFELEGDDIQLPNSPNSANNEPVSKMTKKRDVTEASDCNLYQDLSQTSVETSISMLEKLTELQEENKKLKRQLEEVSNNVCKCNLNIASTDDTDNKMDKLITVKFYNEDVAEEYRTKFRKFLKSFTEFICTEDNLNIDIKSTDGKIDAISDESPSKKRKRKKSKSKSKDMLFTVDSTPSLSTESHLKYVSKYLVTAETENSIKDGQKLFSTVCFNCDKNHPLRDCPEPKNYPKINAARNKLKQTQQAKARYHLDEDQKYAHLKPGEISVELKEALGICPNELPPYIYRMRKCGYPPGWMEDARVAHSNISLFDMDGKESAIKKTKAAFDPEKVIEYPGFNIPMDKGIRDEFKYHDCPPYSEKCSKTMMLEYINKMSAKEEDNLEACDMELDTNHDEVVLPPGCEPAPKLPQAETGRISPSLIDLEAKKMELLAALHDGGVNGNVAAAKTVSNDDKQAPVESTGNKNDDLSDSFVVIDDSEKSVEKSLCDVDDDKDDSVVENVCTPKTDIVRKSTFGTPVVKSASPYSRLPDPEHFSKDVSPVINFENLPNATGKYQQMNGIIQKIRRTLKNFGDKS